MDKNNSILEGKEIGLKISFSKKDNFKSVDSQINTCLIILCTKGKCSILINLKKHELCNGSILYTHMPVSLTKDMLSNDFEGFIISYNHLASGNAEIFKYILPYIFVMYENPIIEIEHQRYKWLKSFLDIVLKRQKLAINAIDLEASNRALMITLIVEIRNFYKELSNKNSCAVNNTRYNRSMQLTKDFCNLLSQNFIKHRDIGFYAEQMCISSKHLSSSVKAATGQKITEIVANIVIMEAKMQLLSTNKTVQEIAFNLNFPNASFFGKFFKKNTGMSPNSFRITNEKTLKKL